MSQTRYPDEARLLEVAQDAARAAGAPQLARSADLQSAATEQSAEVSRYRFQGIFRIWTTLRPTQMRKKDHGSTMF